LAFDHPQPEHRGRNIDSAISGKRPARKHRFNTGEQKRKHRQGDQAGKNPVNASVQSQPGPEGEAPANFGNRRGTIENKRRHNLKKGYLIVKALFLRKDYRRVRGTLPLRRGDLTTRELFHTVVRIKGIG